MCGLICVRELVRIENKASKVGKVNFTNTLWKATKRLNGKLLIGCRPWHSKNINITDAYKYTVDGV
jgi:hypothetical protein